MADITYDLIKDTASFNHIPILTLDKRWYLLVPEVSKTDEIKYWEKKVNDLLKKQGQVTNDLKEVKKIKEQVIQDVVENMEEDGNDFRRKKRMNKNQRLIHEAKDAGFYSYVSYMKQKTRLNHFKMKKKRFQDSWQKLIENFWLKR